MKECCIFAGAAIEDYSPIVLNQPLPYIICADGGYTHAQFLGLKPDVILGDFDTFLQKVPEDCEILRYSSEKDDTDTMLAVKLALERGFTKLSLYGVTGGRLDHTLANIQTLAYILKHRASGVLYGDREQISLLSNGRMDFLRKDGCYFSVFAFGGTAAGVTTTGTKYDLSDAVLTPDFPLGVSNEILNDFATVEVKNGMLMLLYVKK